MENKINKREREKRRKEGRPTVEYLSEQKGRFDMRKEVKEK